MTDVLNTLFTATKRFYFLLANANTSFYFTFRNATAAFRDEMPLWWEWDCETWRNEQWLFSEKKLADMLRDLELKYSSGGGPDKEAQDAEHESDEDSEDDLEDDEMEEVEPERQLLTERDWLRQQMGLY